MVNWETTVQTLSLTPLHQRVEGAAVTAFLLKPTVSAGVLEVAVAEAIAERSHQVAAEQQAKETLVVQALQVVLSPALAAAVGLEL